MLCPLFVGCFKDEEHIDVDPAMLVGTWQQENGSRGQWTFHSGGTGNKVVSSDFDPDDENNGDFTWTLDRDELELTFRGTSGLFEIPHEYVIKEISSSSSLGTEASSRSSSSVSVICQTPTSDLVSSNSFLMYSAIAKNLPGMLQRVIYQYSKGGTTTDRRIGNPPWMCYQSVYNWEAPYKSVVFISSQI